MMVAPQPASAQGEYANVSNVQAFTAQANYMSVPGYLRWVTWRDQQVLLTYAEATRIVIAQGGQVSPVAQRRAEAAP